MARPAGYVNVGMTKESRDALEALAVFLTSVTGKRMSYSRAIIEANRRLRSQDMYSTAHGVARQSHDLADGFLDSRVMQA